MTYQQIAIDGPAVSGKSSAAKLLAKCLDWLYLDSGAVYRTITLASLRGLQIQDPDLFEALDRLKIRLEPIPDGLGCEVYLKEENVSEEIRTEKVTVHILPISGNPEVRDWVTDFLRQLSKGSNVVMDGRDIASVVFPKAVYKFFVTASLESRTRRRLEDLKGKGEVHLYDEIFSMLEKRDEGDCNRKIGPLLQVEDAILIDNSALSIEETVDKMLNVMSQNGWRTQNA